MSVQKEIATAVGTKVAVGLIAVVGAYFLFKYVKGLAGEVVSSIGTAIGDGVTAIAQAPGKAIVAITDPVHKPTNMAVGAPSYASGIDPLNNPFYTPKKNSTSDDSANEWKFYEHLAYDPKDADIYTKEVLTQTFPGIFNFN